MTYEQYLLRERYKALVAIKDERARFKRAEGFFEIYAAGMSGLGLQALAWSDIGGRLIELDIAQRELDEDYADTELNRSRYEAEVSPRAIRSRSQITAREDGAPAMISAATERDQK